jgi:DNA circularisation protein N-terminus
MSNDVLSQLLELQWRDVSMPAYDFDLDLEQDLIQHKWPDHDGAHVEAVGRAPLVFSASIPFLNNITPGPNETWDYDNQVLYPTVFRQFFIAMSDRRSGILQHPEFGYIQCKPRSAKCKWAAQRRDGCIVTASWVESLDDTVKQFQHIITSKSPVSASQAAASDLDSQIADYGNPLVTSDGDTTSFTDDMVTILSAFDAVTLAQYQAGGYIDHVLYRVQALEDRVNDAADVTAWPLVTSCERMKSALYDLQLAILEGDQDVLTITTKQDLTLGKLCVLTGSNITDLLNLNPRLASQPAVPSGTTVRYYKAA